MRAKKLSLLVLCSAAAPLACGPPRPAQEAPPAAEVPSASAQASAPSWRPVNRPATARPRQIPLDNCTPDSTDRAAARGMFQQGVASYSSGDYSAALASFERVYSLTCTPQVLYNIAVTREVLGDVDGAIDAFELYLSRAPENGRRAAEVEEKLRVLRARR